MRSMKERRHGNNAGSTKELPRRSRFSASTKGIRLPDDLEAWVDAEQARNPELTYSRLVRESLRLEKARREGIVLIIPANGHQKQLTFQSISGYLASMSKSHARGSQHTPAHSAVKRIQSPAKQDAHSAS